MLLFIVAFPFAYSFQCFNFFFKFISSVEGIFKTFHSMGVVIV